MFSKGTYNRYLFEVDSTHKRMIETYGRLEGRLQDPNFRKALSDFVHQIEAEQKTIGDIRNLMQSSS